MLFDYNSDDILISLNCNVKRVKRIYVNICMSFISHKLWLL